MDQETMVRIAEEEGYILRAYVYIQGIGKTWSLGRLEDVAALPEEELREYIAAKTGKVKVPGVRK